MFEDPQDASSRFADLCSKLSPFPLVFDDTEKDGSEEGTWEYDSDDSIGSLGRLSANFVPGQYGVNWGLLQRYVSFHSLD